MTVHELKIWPDSFAALVAGDKKAEFRENDRDFRVGDVLVLKEWVPRRYALTKRMETESYIDHYTGDELRATVTHILDGLTNNFGVPPGYVVMSIVVGSITLRARPEEPDVEGHPA